MNTKPHDGGPAFPVDEINQQAATDVFAQHFGMTLLDHFATHAMQGWLATYGEHEHPALRQDTAEHVANLSYAMAKAMLKAKGLQ